MRETEVPIRMVFELPRNALRGKRFGVFIRLSRYQFIILAIYYFRIFPKFSTVLYCDIKLNLPFFVCFLNF